MFKKLRQQAAQVHSGNHAAFLNTLQAHVRAGRVHPTEAQAIRQTAAAATQFNTNNSSTMADKVKSFTPGRALYDFVVKKYPGVKSISPSYLRVEQILLNNESGYSFDVFNGGGNNKTEKLLNKADVFHAETFAFLLAQRTDAAEGKTALQSFPNNALLDGANVTVADLMSVYNGEFKIQIGETVYFDGTDMQNFYYAPVTQADAVANSANQRDGKTHPFMKLTPSIKLGGDNNIDISAKIKTFAGMKIEAGTNGVHTILVFYARGFLVKNGANQK